MLHKKESYFEKWRCAIFILVWVVGIFYVYRDSHFNKIQVEIEMASTKSGIVQLFADDGYGFREQLSVHQDVIPSIGTISYSLELDLPSGVKALRLDPINTSARIYIENLALTYLGKKIVFSDSDLTELHLLHDIESLPETENRILGRSFQTTGNDPMLLLNLPGVFHEISTLEYTSAYLSYYLGNLDVWALILFGVGLGIFINRPETREIYSLPANYTLHVIAGLFPVVLLWILYYNALDNWFGFDDPCHMLYLFKIGIWPSFFDPARGGSSANFTPFFFLSFGMDFYIFGLKPIYYYWHHFISFSLTLFLLYAVFAHFLSPVAAIFTLSLFVASVPSAEAANLLMERHYIEGMGLAAAALICFIYSVKRNNRLVSIAGSFFYLMASIAKELYVPLVVLLPFMPLSTWRKRAPLLIPYIVMALFYILWRAYMLSPGRLTKGYLQIDQPTLKDILDFPWAYSVLMQYSIIQIGLIGFGILLFIRYLVQKRQEIGLFFFLAVISVIVPFFPVLTILASRYVFVFALFLYVLAFVGIESFDYIKNKRVVINIIGGVFLLVNLNSIQQHKKIFAPVLNEFETRSLFLLQSSDKNDVMIDSAHCLSSYLILREHYPFLGEGSIVSGKYDLCIDRDDDYLSLLDYYQYIDGKMVKRLLKNLSLHCDRMDLKKEFWIKMVYNTRSKELEWEFGPYSDLQGDYYAIGGISYSPVPLKSEGNISAFVNYDMLSNIRIIYKDNSGWETITPQLDIYLTKANADGIAYYEWRRSSQME